ncbi:Bcr/CflA family efflux MFS transporter [Sphingomonas bacterium]|uniref:Bcr/CflA family efflux MFS transporter n=1 Tax=Sphingomonas bacterium TaxID=1895847 RepID=UPI0020C68AE4|nr:Bcr/CflA family efflux MFS transporter [Sphingomonas bacterium]
MSPSLPLHPTRQRAPIALGEFVALVAALQAVGALGVDAMLPALPAIGAELHARGANATQFVISVYLLGLGVGQLIHGPLSDHAGRRPVMLAALCVYGLAGIAATGADSFAMLLAARFVGAVAVAATRVVTVATVRDCYSGRPMAKVMSLASMVFMIAPVLAPTLGQGLLFFGSWRLIFGGIAGLTMIVTVWYWRRLPETLAREGRLPFSAPRVASGVRQVLGNRWSLGYMLAATALQGALFGYITCVQPMVTGALRAGPLLNVVFAVTAGAMAAANLLNSRFVLRIGSRVLSQAALVAMILAAGAALAAGLSGRETLLGFVLFQAVAMASFALANSNFSALAMTDMGAIAGTASSVQGFVTITVGTMLGAAMGQSYAGTTTPLHLGFLLAGLFALGCVAVTERGLLFRAG